MDMIETLGKAGIIPVIVIDKEEQAVPQSVMVDMTHFSKRVSDIYAWRDSMADILEK